MAVKFDGSAPLYCLHGHERFLLGRALRSIRSAFDGAAGGMNVDVFELEDSGIGPALAAAETLPMFAKRRLVIAHGVDELGAEDLAPLVGYAANPNPTTCLVLTAAKIDGRLKVFAALRKAGALHEFAQVQHRDLPAWIQREAAAMGAVIDPDAARMVADRTAPGKPAPGDKPPGDLGRVVNALEALHVYVGGGKERIRIAHVMTLVPPSRERSVFELTKAISEGSVPGSLAALAAMVDQPQFRGKEIMVAFMLTKQVRQIWRAKEMLAAGRSRDEIAVAVKVPPFFLDDVLGPARRMSYAALKRSFDLLCAADQALKSSRVDRSVQLGRLVLDLATCASGKTV